MPCAQHVQKTARPASWDISATALFWCYNQLFTPKKLSDSELLQQVLFQAQLHASSSTWTV